MKTFTNKAIEKTEDSFERILFLSRWMQAPVYAGLVVASLLYSYRFMVELYHLTMNMNSMDETMFMLGILGLVDISMVINLLVVVFIGGYITFVSKIDFGTNVDKPEWLSKVNANTLKIKLIISLVSISGVHLLKLFIDTEHVPLQQIIIKITIHVIFIVSALILAITDKISDESHKHS